MRISISDKAEDKVRDSFRKIQDYIYFENTDLHIRDQLVEFLSNDGVKKLERLLLDITSASYQDGILKKIKLRYYPKKVENDLGGFKNGIPSNFVTNVFNENGCNIERLIVFCDIPIELHIISVLWILDFGYLLDRQIGPNAYGNRLILHKGKLLSGRALFKPYIRQYHKWWADGIDAAKQLLNKGKDVTIINFDLKDYFHAVQFDVDKLDSELLHSDPLLNTDHPVHVLFKKIHRVYAEQLSKINHPAYKEKRNHYPLPIGLLSSFVLANWHLKSLDSLIESKYTPVFYGRYVDDFLIVLKGKILRKGEENETLIDTFINKHFSDLFNSKNTGDQKGYFVNIDGLDNLSLQQEKIFIYQFDSRYSPNLLSKFIEEQKERSSEFRFLSDQEDDNFGDFEENVFESNFENEDVNKAKFKKLEENRFKVSAYLAKLIQRIIERGSEYKSEEIEKVEKYFRGHHSIKYYFFWEKLFTLYVVSGNIFYFKELLGTITGQLKKVKVSYSLNVNKEEVVQHLNKHLNKSVEMSLGLNPSFATKEIRDAIQDATEVVVPNHFRKFGLLRKQYVYYPILQLSRKAVNEAFSLIDKNIFRVLNWEKADFEILNIEYVPFRVKFYECALHLYNKRFFSINFEKENNKRFINDLAPSEEVMEEAFKAFYTINNPMSSSHETEVKAEYFQISDISENDKVRANEIFFKSSGNSKKEYRIGIVSQYISIETIRASLDGSPILNAERVETFSFILDQVSKVKGLDIFVMPEVALPYALVKKFAKFSVDNQSSFVSGIEHLRVGDIAVNLILTCLPVSVDGDRDAIPIFRVKNHYAPEEEELIWNKNLIPLKPKTYCYDLFEWRGLYFSSYYCFELADIHHRTLFYSKLDLICASVWNADTHYYSNIIESTTRDLHCYFVQVNTSQYGDSRITRPTDHVRKDKAKVKGGTVFDYKINLLVGDIAVGELRQFQKLDYSGQRKEYQGKRPFKPTPPDFPIENIIKREMNLRIGRPSQSSDLPF